MNRIGFQFNNEDENIFDAFDKYVDSSKLKITKAADKLLKLYKSDQVDAETREKLINLEKRLRLVFKEVDKIDKDVEGLARLDRLKKQIESSVFVISFIIQINWAFNYKQPQISCCNNIKILSGFKFKKVTLYKFGIIKL